MSLHEPELLVAVSFEASATDADEGGAAFCFGGDVT
jgi:hypothetical protein